MDSREADAFWRDGGGIPHYLQAKARLSSHSTSPLLTPRQSDASSPDCSDCSKPVGYVGPPDGDTSNTVTSADYDPLWSAIVEEARADSVAEPLLSSFLYAAILSQKSFDHALANVLANRLACAQLLPTQLYELCLEVLLSQEEVRLAARCDVAATRARDPACRTHAHCLLNLKGYQAVQTYRIAHALHAQGRRLLSQALQSRSSEVFAVDIHPAAHIGRGILLDHGTGVVIGETAVVGDRVSIMQGVTLGGTGKDLGDRHPKVGQGVLIGAHACVLGNIEVGEGAMIAAGSLVLKAVPPHAMVSGSPAKQVGMAADPFPSLGMKQSESLLQLLDAGEEQWR
jgi:serine O-acetyltransferase